MKNKAIPITMGKKKKTTPINRPISKAINIIHSINGELLVQLKY